MSRDIDIYRMNIKPNEKEGYDAFDFCLKNNIVGSGWPLADENNTRIVPKDLEEYEVLGRKQYPKDNGFAPTVNAYKRMQEDDLIWIRKDGIYYLCRVTGPWFYGFDEENYNNDILSSIPVEIIEVGAIDNVPAKVVNSFRRGRLIQRTLGKATTIISKLIYNEKTNTEFYEVEEIDKKDLLTLLLPEDVEEIVSLYLQVDYNYLIYSSTNKLDTAKYEFVGVARDGSHKCYPQVKTGNTSLNFNDFDHLTSDGNKVYLYATNEIYITNNNKNIVSLKNNEILSFIFKNKQILPDRIKMWIEII